MNSQGAKIAKQGFICQMVLVVVLFLLSGLTSERAITASMTFALAGVPAWFCIWNVYKLFAGEVDECESEMTGEAGEEESLSPRQRYRNWVNMAGGTTAAVLLALTFSTMMGFQPSGGMVMTARTRMVLTWATAGTAVISFLAVRYFGAFRGTAGLGLLRAGTGYIRGTILYMAACSAGLFLAGLGFPAPLRYIGKTLPILNFVIGVEVLLYIFLEFYRPKARDEYPRPFFHSRILDLLDRSANLSASIRDTLNYQFGFEVSGSWFAEVLARSAWPLVGLSVGSLLFLSSLVRVEPNQQAVITRLGRHIGEPLCSGLHMKAPWPIDRAHLYDVTTIRRIHVGSHRPGRSGGDIYKQGVPILWTNEHGVTLEHYLIVAPPSDLLMSDTGGSDDLEDGGGINAKTPSVSLAGGDIFVEYRIGDLMDYVKNSIDAEKTFRQIAELEASRELYRYDVDTLIGEGRAKAAKVILEAIRKASDKAELGIDVIYVGIVGVHPPQSVAASFEGTVTARQERETSVQIARQTAISVMTETAGTEAGADSIIKDIEVLEGLVQDGEDPKRILLQQEMVESALCRAGGRVAERMADAIGYRWRRENAERGKAERFSRDLNLYELAPDYYRTGVYLDVQDKGLEKARKYILTGDREKIIFRLNFGAPGISTSTGLDSRILSRQTGEKR